MRSDPVWDKQTSGGGTVKVSRDSSDVCDAADISHYPAFAGSPSPFDEAFGVPRFGKDRAGIVRS
ncbi:MAG: hypothetical protein DI606_05015 [Sphingobium sp.]|uniref:hypothetical protein n=1 Tax=Sphingobium sp. TaxID=1912891 RepID=UPI000DB36ACB|nr:hypothetical protein [Sphingobium sp.]PZU13639.1 MAG: hypothetical protein DI606_05015 [Sphingobium sp.]